MSCLTEKDIQIQQEKEKRWKIEEQKKSLLRIQSKYARRIYPDLHEKTHKKGATSLLMSDTKVMSV